MQNVILDGGLDLATARPATLPGRIRDCLNYEANGWRRGYTRIDGWERFDGSTSPSITTGWNFYVLNNNITGAFNHGVIEELTWSNQNGSGPAGTLVQSTGSSFFTQFWVVLRTGRRRPEFGDLITGNTTGASFLLADVTQAQGIQTFVELNPDHSTYLTMLDDFGTLLRDRVLPVPGGGTIVGLHYHEDQLYAIRDVSQVTISAAEANTLQPGMFVVNAAGEIGEVLAVSADGETVNIAATVASGFTLAVADTISIALSIRYNTGSGTFTAADLVLAGTSGWAGAYGYGENRDGAFSSDNGLGVAVFIDPTNNVALTVGETFDNLSATGSMVVESVQFPYQQDVATVVTTSSQSSLATMWRSTDAGWDRATTGRSLGFYAGVLDPVSAPVPGTKVSYATDVGRYASGGANETPWSTPYSNVEGAPDATIIACTPFVGGFAELHQSDVLYAKGFTVGLLDSDTITGVSVEYRCENTLPAASANIKAAMLLGGGGTVSVAMPETGVLSDVTAGGIDNLWGATLTPAIVNSASYGITMQAWCGTVAVSNVELDSVELTVYYTRPPGEKLYLYDPSAGIDIGYIGISDVVLTSGTWVGGDAAGYFRVKDWTTVSIPVETQIRTEPAGAGALIALAGGNLAVPTLPGSLLLDENNSKYEMISYNFFASEEQNAIYGVSGAGLAFWYDGTTLDFIPTGVELSKDKPRHIAPHENRLALGYIWGEVYLSGTDPLVYGAATDLAASFGFGDKITGLMPAPGKALAVFTESSTNVLIGAPVSFADPLTGVDQQVVNHRVGAIEYTVQNIGNAPIFATFRGIETLETMDQYSDFFTAPLTYDVSSWLLERLQSESGVEATNKSVMASVVVRNKNQYRLFFADGYVLTLTFVGKEKEPQCLIQQYWFQDDRLKYARVFATASGVTSGDKDRVFFSVEERIALATDPPATGIGDNLNYVYEIDRGRSFDGHEIEAYFDLTHYYSSSRQLGPLPEKNHRFNCFQMHGVCAGTADLHVSRAINYDDLDDPVQGNEPTPFYSGLLPPQDQALPKYTKGRLNGRGFAVSLHVSHRSKLEFPHTLQMVTFLNDTELKEDR